MALLYGSLFYGLVLIAGLAGEPSLLSIRLTIKLNLPQHKQKVRAVSFLIHKQTTVLNFHLGNRYQTKLF